MGINKNSVIFATLIESIVVLHRTDCNSDGRACKINELGAIELPVEILYKLNLQEEDHIAIYHTENTMILKKA